MADDDARAGDPRDDDPRSRSEQLHDLVVDIGLTAAWYFGGAVMLIAGQPLWAAVAVTVGALAFWRHRNRRRDEYGRKQLPPIPEARLLESGERAVVESAPAPERQRPPSGGP